MINSGYIRTIEWVVKKGLLKSKKIFFVRCFYGVLSIACQYVALYVLAKTLEAAAVLSIAKSTEIWGKLILNLPIYFGLIIAEALLIKSFYAANYKKWSDEATKMSGTVINKLRSLPDPALGKLNEIMLGDKLSIMSAGRPQAFGAFLFYFNRNVIDSLKTFVFVVLIAILDYRFIVILVVVGSIGLYFTMHGHRQVTVIAGVIEKLQIKSGRERVFAIRNKESMDWSLESTSNYFDSVVKSYFQARSNQAILSFMNAFLVVIFVCFMVFFGVEENIQWSDLLLVFLCARILMGSINQLANGVLMMNRQYTQVVRLKKFIEEGASNGEQDAMQNTLLFRGKSGEAIEIGSNECVGIVFGHLCSDLPTVLCLLYSVVPSQGAWRGRHEFTMLPKVNDIEKIHKYYAAVLNDIDLDRMLPDIELRSRLVNGLDASFQSEFCSLKLRDKLLLTLLIVSFQGYAGVIIPRNYFYTLQRHEVRDLLKFSKARLYVLYNNDEMCENIVEEKCFYMDVQAGATLSMTENLPEINKRKLGVNVDVDDSGSISF